MSFSFSCHMEHCSTHHTWLSSPFQSECVFGSISTLVSTVFYYCVNKTWLKICFRRYILLKKKKRYSFRFRGWQLSLAVERFQEKSVHVNCHYLKTVIIRKCTGKLVCCRDISGHCLFDTIVKFSQQTGKSYSTSISPIFGQYIFCICSWVFLHL